MPDLLRVAVLAVATFSIVMVGANTMNWWPSLVQSKSRQEAIRAAFVIMIFVSEVLFVVGASIELIIRFGDVITWRTPFYFVALVMKGLGNFAYYSATRLEGGPRARSS
jgi:hypothetical protein